MKISVIVPVYNNLPLLSGCLDSICQQTWKDFECVCIDDGSTDGSAAFLDAYVQKDPRFSVIHQPNASVSGARNTGMDKVRGDYVFFVDNDDYIHPQTLEMLYTFATEHKAEVVACAFVDTTATFQQTTFTQLNPADYQPVQIKNPLESFMKKRVIRSGVPLKLYKRSVLEGIRFHKMRYEDVPFTFELMMQAQSVWVSKAPLYYYYANPDSMMRGSFDQKKLDSYLKLFEIINEDRLKLPPHLCKQAQTFVINTRLKMCFNRIAKKQKDPKIRAQLLACLQEKLPDLKARDVISYKNLPIKHACLLWMLLHGVKVETMIRFLRIMY